MLLSFLLLLVSFLDAESLRFAPLLPDPFAREFLRLLSSYLKEVLCMAAKESSSLNFFGL